MLVSIVMLGEHAGSYRWSQAAAAPPPGRGYLAVVVVLLLAGPLSKSAIFPFSFWLPRAMAAPTPVSAYLHAAAMVKAEESAQLLRDAAQTALDSLNDSRTAPG